MSLYEFELVFLLHLLQQKKNESIDNIDFLQIDYFRFLITQTTLPFNSIPQDHYDSQMNPFSSLQFSIREDTTEYGSIVERYPGGNHTLKVQVKIDLHE